MSEEQPPKIRIQDKRVSSGDGPQGVHPPSGSSGDEPTPDQVAATELEEANRLAQERYDQLLRLRADFENFRKRELREKTELVDRASHRVVEMLLPVLDNFQRALEAAREHGSDAGLLKGVELVFRQLHDVLVSEGLELVEADGLAFDPHEHEAMVTEPADVSEPTVLEVVRPGYRLKGRMIRPALVRVATPPDQGAGGADDSQETRG